MPLIVPVNNTGDRRIQVLLGDNLISIRTYFNPTVPAWYMDLTDSDGVDIALGLALVPVINVLESRPDLTRIYGQFRVVTDGDNNTQDSLGSTAKLWWFAPGEWEAEEGLREQETFLPFDVRSMYRVYTASFITPEISMIFIDQTSFTSDPITVTGKTYFDVYLTVTGPGPVLIEQLEEDATWRSFPETEFSGDTAQIVTVKSPQFRVAILGGPTTVEVRVL